MKRYVVRNKTTQQVFGKFDTQNQASEKLVEYITEQNDEVCSDEAGFLSIFDFEVKEEDVQEISSYTGACEYLGLSEEVKDFDKLFVRNKKHTTALRALSKLFTIAEAWNKEDGFVPDFSNEEQRKYFPWFEYNKRSAGFVCANTHWTATTENAGVGSQLCFATRERALDFGKKFESLYNDFLLLDK